MTVSHLKELVIENSFKHNMMKLLTLKLSLQTAARELKCNHVRLCGIMIQISNNCEIMCLNVYMPCDGKSEDDNLLNISMF